MYSCGPYAAFATSDATGVRVPKPRGDVLSITKDCYLKLTSDRTVMLTIGEPELWKNKGRVFIELGVLEEPIQWDEITAYQFTRDQEGMRVILKTNGPVQLVYKLPLDSPAYRLLYGTDFRY